MRRRVRLIVVVIVWWLAWGVVNAVNLGRMYAAGGTPPQWGHIWGTEMTSSLLWVPITLAVLWFAARWPLSRSGVTGFAVHAGGLLGTIAGRAGVVQLTNEQLHWFDGSVPPWNELLLISVYNNLFMYGLITIAAHALYFARAHREREAQLARAELEALRAQIQPHFLFNALNTIAAFVHDEPETSERMIVGLGALLRRSLDSDGRLLVPLSEELEVLRAYLEIEQVRFADRLKVVWEIDPRSLAAQVPPLVLQPLAENAVRHGLWPGQRQGELRIVAACQNDRLQVTVADDGVGLAPGVKYGIGLTNTSARLRQLYGAHQAFQLRTRTGGGTEATIEVPLRV